ncbi:MAG TPA: hypothetical protein VGW38_16180 [Chloroflexota bacterium]|nr:hypothetical protein [Chloroflexota bacterium]
MTTMVRRDCLAGYDEGMLKALLDGELSAAWQETIREHATGCGACNERLSRLRLDGALVQGRLQLLGGAPAGGAAYVGDFPALPPRPPVAAVLARAKKQEDVRERIATAARRWLRPTASRPVPWAAGAAAAAMLVGVCSTPVGQSFAQGVFQSLRVQRVQPVAIDVSALRVLPIDDVHDLSKLGTYSGPKEPKIRVASVAEAARSTGLALRAPAQLPGSLGNTRSIYVSEPVDFSMTYDGAKIVQTAREMGVSDPALEAELRTLNGVTVKGSVPAAAAFIYGAPPIGGATTNSANSSAKPRQADGAAGADRQVVLFAQLKSPSLEVPQSVNVDRLRELLLKSGAVPPALANQLLAIQDWKTTLPIPIVRGTSKQVSVDGTTGTLVTGEAPVPALIWQKNDVLYVLAGSLSEADLLNAARSLQPVR